MRFANPENLLILLIIVPLIVWHYKMREHATPRILFPNLSAIKDINSSPKVKLINLPKYLRWLALFLLILAFARPQAGQKSEEIYNQGIDIMIALDTSTSMRALDFNPDNRLDMAKKLAKQFVAGREFDRIGMVVFAGLSFTQCPLTSDHQAVLDFIDQVEIGMTQVDGTAIGSAIATATNRLKDSPGKSQIMILITDGRSNMGEIDPITAAQAAAALDTKIYTIGAGKIGESLYPVDDPLFGRRYVRVPQQDLDEDTLAKIAEATEGRYFRATDRETFKRIFERIDKMEKVEIKTLTYTNYDELFIYFLWPAFFMLLLEIFLKNIWLRKIP